MALFGRSRYGGLHRLFGLCYQTNVFQHDFIEFGEEKLLSPKFPLLDNLKKFHDTTTLIFSNAKAYNNEDSQIYQDAVILEEYFNEQYNKLKSRIELEADKLHPSTPKLKLNLGRIGPSVAEPQLKKRERDPSSKNSQKNKFTKKKKTSI